MSNCFICDDNEAIVIHDCIKVLTFSQPLINGHIVLAPVSHATSWKDLTALEKEKLFTEERVSNKQDKPLKTKNETKGKKAKKINNKQKLQMPKKLQTKDVANKVADKVQNIKSSSTIKSSSINKTVQNTAAKKAE